MGDVINLEDPFCYVMDGKECAAVKWQRGRNSVHFSMEGHIECDIKQIPPHELKELMVMWLGVKYPDKINWDNEHGETIEDLRGRDG